MFLSASGIAENLTGGAMNVQIIVFFSLHLKKKELQIKMVSCNKHQDVNTLVTLTLYFYVESDDIINGITAVYP